jgi:two-component system response regulator RegX3
VVEDDGAVRAIVGEVCRLEGYEVTEAATGSLALEMATSSEFDVLLLDWVLPDLSGIEICRELRRQGTVCPIVLLTGRTAKVDVVVGLEVGADDYITKPFDVRELTARLRAHLRRSRMVAPDQRPGVDRVGAVDIDGEGRRVRVGEFEVKLTLPEYNQLTLLAANPGRVLTRSQLLDKVWGYLAEVDRHSVDAHVQRLRRKLQGRGNSGVSLEAVPGLGYRLSPRS